ncbi:RICIN domain-containing protein [Streptomyces collinus]
MEDAGNGRVRLLNRHSGLYLTAGSAQGDQLVQRPYDGADHQMFTVS